jgi:hypothetical protein
MILILPQDALQLNVKLAQLRQQTLQLMLLIAAVVPLVMQVLLIPRQQVLLQLPASKLQVRVAMCADQA